MNDPILFLDARRLKNSYKKDQKANWEIFNMYYLLSTLIYDDDVIWPRVRREWGKL